MDEVLEKLNINQGVFDELNGIKLLDLVKHPKYLDKIDEEDLEDMEEEESDDPTTFELSGEHLKIDDDHDLLILGFDYIVIVSNNEIECIFNVYDLENYYYDEDIDCVMASGHETSHRYILHSKKYKRVYTR